MVHSTLFVLLYSRTFITADSLAITNCMNRRDFLASLGSALTISIAGCSKSSTQPTTTPRLVETQPQTRTGEANDFLSTYSTATITARGDIPLEYSASLEPTPTKNHPPRVKMTLTNPTQQSLKFADSRSAFFWLSTAGTESIRLYPPSPETSDVYRNVGCWKRNKPEVLTEELQSETIDPGESITKTGVLAVTPYVDCPKDLSEPLQFTSDIQIAELTFTETGAYWSDIVLKIQ